MTLSLLPDLKIGIMMEDFSDVGNMPVSRQRLQMCVIGLHRYFEPFFRKIADMPSHPADDEFFSDFIIVVISTSSVGVKRIELTGDDLLLND